MDCKKLFEEEKYGLVIELFKNSSNPRELFYVISSLCQISKYKEALDLLITNRELLFNENPIITLRHNFEIRYLLKQFDEAYEDLKVFENYPYVSQEVEEYLRALPKQIRENEKKSYLSKDRSIDDLKEILSSNNEAEILAILPALKDKDLSLFFDDLERICNSRLHKDVRVYCLLLLVFGKLDKEIIYNSGKECITVNPSRLIPPFVGKDYEQIRVKLSSLKDASLTQVATSLFSAYVLDIYPNSIFEEESLNLIATSFEELAKKYLQIESNLIDEEVKNYIEKIEKVLAENPPIKL